MILLAAGCAVLITISIVCAMMLIGPDGSMQKRAAIGNRIYSDSQGLDMNSFSTESSLLIKDNYSDIKSLNKLLKQYGKMTSISESISRAGLNVSVSVVYIFSLLLFMTTYAIVSLKVSSMLLGLVLGGIAMSLPFFYLNFKNKQYINKFSELMPNALSLILNGIKVGQGIEMGFATVAKSKLYPVSLEFRRIQNIMHMGLQMDEAMAKLYERIPIPEVKIFATGLAIHSEFGGNLSESLEILEQTIRERFALKREIKALSAQGVTSSAVLVCVPFAVAALWTASDPEMVIGWGRTTAGKIGLSYCAFMIGLAIIIMRKMLDLKP